MSKPKEENPSTSAAAYRGTVYNILNYFSKFTTKNKIQIDNQKSNDEKDEENISDSDTKYLSFRNGTDIAANLSSPLIKKRRISNKNNYSYELISTPDETNHTTRRRKILQKNADHHGKYYITWYN